MLGIFGEGLEIGRGAYLGLERSRSSSTWCRACAAAIPVRLLRGAIVALIAAFTLAPPLLSLDVFSYISYARLEVLHGLNPYDHVPLDAPGDEALAFIERWRDVSSAYGPVFTLGSLPLGELGVGGAPLGGQGGSRRWRCWHLTALVAPAGGAPRARSAARRPRSSPSTRSSSSTSSAVPTTTR